MQQWDEWLDFSTEAARARVRALGAEIKDTEEIRRKKELDVRETCSPVAPSLVLSFGCRITIALSSVVFGY